MAFRAPIIIGANSGGVSIPIEESDRLVIRPLGAGQEVGRSCVLLEYKDKRIIFDCGIHPGRQGLDALPLFESVDLERVDLLLITHFHLDHCGALPWLFKNTNFRGRCYMTHPTKAIYRWLLADFIRVSHLAVDDMLFSEQDVEKSMGRVQTVDFHQQVDVDGIKFSSYQAGHVLGAAMFMVEVAGVRVLYTGDFSCEEDRHLMAAEIPPQRPHVAICEATYGTHVHDPMEQREARFTGLVHNIINRGGRCLVPVFALGRTQELLLILDEYWASHPELHDVPVYYASQLAKKCMSVYQTFGGAMNEKMRRRLAAGANPFVFKYIASVRSADQLDDAGPCVVLASPGMLQSGLSRELFERWCSDPRNGVIIAGYCVEGTLAKQILSNPPDVPSMQGTNYRLPLRCSVDYVSFSAHTDFAQTSLFLATVRAPHVVLVHGEATEMARLKAALDRQHEDAGAGGASGNVAAMRVYTPRNTQAVEFRFRGEKLAKVAGHLAEQPPVPGQGISGVAVKRNYRLTVVDPADLHTMTGLQTAQVTQRISLPFLSGHVAALELALNQLSGDLNVLPVEETPTDGKTRMAGPSRSMRVFCDSITVTFTPTLEPPKPLSEDADAGDIAPADGVTVMEWLSGPTTDMLADIVLATVTAIACCDGEVLRSEIPEGSDEDTSKDEAQRIAAVVQPVLLQTFGYFCHH